MMWGIDISAKCTGWAAGDGSGVPTCGTWTGYDETATDYGAMLVMWRRDLTVLAERFPPTHVIYESPLLIKFDRLPTLRRTYSLGTHLELWGKDHGVVVQEEDPKKLKKRLTGDSYAKKADMVRMAKRMGVVLPPGPADGPAGDAADAFAAWLICVQHHDKANLALWDQALYSRRGALL